ncbi:hypothetical protein M878_11430 [Streptomyces roseochromogenus subsp. oscitans DS 12.976]|uniref:Uncharacterized protein n=1 Tax=Streptomyces roseochromogenus subsp. oscitans DS 12.976 TaxID=1352936 RepID=V6KYX9_STRRC|nr:hypothetical protein M878_11430 [Streptomyces roseochromogenus subsp. oscitans DS 12.976]
MLAAVQAAAEHTDPVLVDRLDLAEHGVVLLREAGARSSPCPHPADRIAASASDARCPGPGCHAGRRPG